MKRSKILRALAVATALGLLMLLIPVAPVLAASIMVSPTSGPPGTTVTVTGTAFSPSHDIEILFDSARQHLFMTSTTSFSKVFTVPAGKEADTYLVEVIDWSLSTPAVVASTTFTVIAGQEADINIDPDEGPVGTEVEIDGEDFDNREDIFIEFDGDDIDIESGDTRTDSDGDFTCTIIIPKATAGDHTITVTGEDSDLEAEAEFTVEPEITVSPTSAAPNSNITVKGTGFSRRADLSIYLGNQLMLEENADSEGGFEITFTLINIQPGTYNIEVDDEDDNSAKVKITVEIQTKVDIGKTEGNVGDTTKVSGTGFQANGSITITYEDTIPTRVTATADSNGAFSATLPIPPSRHGEHTITITDGTITKELTFTVESEPPAVVVLQSPAEGTRTEKSKDITLDWGDVTDESAPVTYVLQIATSQEFTADSIVLQASGLQESEYTITAEEQENLIPEAATEEKAKEITLYWRGKAVDSASNESSWSSASSFDMPLPKAGFSFGGGDGFPTWALYTIFAVVAILFGLLGFWAGRRTAYY